jgi:hypothetical protein
MRAAGVTAVTVAATMQPGQHPHQAQQAGHRPPAGLSSSPRGYSNAAIMRTNIPFRAADIC